MVLKFFKILFTIVLLVGVMPKSFALDFSDCHGEHHEKSSTKKSESKHPKDCTEHKKHCCHSISIFCEMNQQKTDFITSTKLKDPQDYNLGKITNFSNQPFHPPCA
jgi:hypothetical protein